MDLKYPIGEEVKVVALGVAPLPCSDQAPPPQPPPFSWSWALRRKRGQRSKGEGSNLPIHVSGPGWGERCPKYML